MGACSRMSDRAAPRSREIRGGAGENSCPGRGMSLPGPRHLPGVLPTPIPMKLVSLLSERRILPEMVSETHWDALGELVDHLISIGCVESGRRLDVLGALHAREEQVSTGIGHGVAIPHCYCEWVEEPVAALGRSPGGVGFEACDNAPVHFVILLIVPKNQPHAHLKTLASIAGLFSQCEVRKKMSEALTADDLMRTLEKCEEEVG